MLERYFVRPVTVDRIRALWLGPAIERYVGWLEERRATAATVVRHVRSLQYFNHFVVRRAVKAFEELPAHVQPFVDEWRAMRCAGCTDTHQNNVEQSNARVPVEQMLQLVVPGFARADHRVLRPFLHSVPGFFPYLREEKGLRPVTCNGYACQLRVFENYLHRTGNSRLGDLTPPTITTFLIERAKTVGPAAMQGCTGTLRVFLRYLHRQEVIATDLSRAVPRGRGYKQATIPRAIAWEDVQRMLDSVERRWALGKRDYAILMLLASYGLRAREIAALQLDDLDWMQSQLRVPTRKGGHSAIYPLSASVGEAIIDYLRNGRPNVDHRHVFLISRMPFTPMAYFSVANVAAHYLNAAGVKVSRPGSHTLRHTCVQRLVESDVSFKAIGDYVGHSRSESTLVYAKVALHRLRQLAIGDAEEAL
ncbi:Tyrosine recombinase XerD [Hydrogenophaga sp. T4]|nr:Tyrosine recombinase XerD [Hydrogenophaga sp. T4]MDZ4290372.1 tyrosine-type recombinase/integrase [Hydrogenophaga sp.]